nr:SPOR domain-containing protein [Paracoccaceae bacterium]
MTDFTYGSEAVAAPSSSRTATLTNLAGAVISLALLVGVGVWGYKLLVRDVSGIPVVQAMEGPMRVAPEDPGGRLADHQGLAVNRVVGAGGTEPPAERLVLAPRPAGLASEDVALGTIRPTARAAPQPA